MSVRRRIAGMLLGIATLSLLPLTGAPAHAESAKAAEAPVVTTVGHAFPTPPATVSQTQVTVRITWQATQGSAGVCDYFVYRYRGGSYETSFYATGKFVDQQLIEGYGYQFYVYPIDCNGVWGTGGVSNYFATTRWTEADVQRSGPNWSYKTTTGAIGNRILTNTSKGSSFSVYTCYTNFAWIAQKNPQGGTASVKVDGVQLATVNLYSATVKQRQLVAKTFDSGNGCHTVTVTNTSTGARNQLNVDGLFVQYE
jgi:hypothetical protein